MSRSRAASALARFPKFTLGGRGALILLTIKHVIYQAFHYVQMHLYILYRMNCNFFMDTYARIFIQRMSNDTRHEHGARTRKSSRVDRWSLQSLAAHKPTYQR